METQPKNPKYSVGDKVQQLSDLKLVLTVDRFEWIGHTYRYGFKECYLECFEEYLISYIPYDNKRTTRMLHCQCLYEIENNLPRTIYCFVACIDQREILAYRNNIEKARRNE